MKRSKENMLLYSSIGSFFLMSVSFLLMPIDFLANNMQILSLLIGGMFWLFLILGIVTQFMLSRVRKSWAIRNRVRKFQLKGKIGLIAFAQNLPACIADVVFVFSIIGFIISVKVTDAMGYACYIFMALLVFSFCMHCILNGKIYFFLVNKDKILKNLQAKNLKESEKE